MKDPRISLWPPLPLRVYARRRAVALPFPLDRPECRIFARGRHALMEGARVHGLGHGAQILTPAYNHGSEVEALAKLGAECVFYGGTDRLEPDERELEQLLGPRVRALSLIHYLGFPQDAARWRRWCDDHGLLLIEDSAQSWLGEVGGTPVGSHGDIAMFCLYKTFGFPDGAALLSPRVPVGPKAVGPSGVATALRRHAAWIASRSRIASEIVGRLQHDEAYDPTLDFALGDPEEGPTAATLRLLPYVIDRSAPAARRTNYRQLLDAFAGMVPPPFDILPAGASPFVFPVETDDPPAMLRRLGQHGVIGAAFWSAFHPSIPRNRFPALSVRRARTVSLPVHQELTAADLDRIIDAARPSRLRPVRVVPNGSVVRRPGVAGVAAP